MPAVDCFRQPHLFDPISIPGSPLNAQEPRLLGLRERGNTKIDRSPADEPCKSCQQYSPHDPVSRSSRMFASGNMCCTLGIEMLHFAHIAGVSYMPEWKTLSFMTEETA